MIEKARTRDYSNSMLVTGASLVVKVILFMVAATFIFFLFIAWKFVLVVLALVLLWYVAVVVPPRREARRKHDAEHLAKYGRPSKPNYPRKRYW